jgi:hypothetical protein
VVEDLAGESAHALVNGLTNQLAEGIPSLRRERVRGAGIEIPEPGLPISAELERDQPFQQGREGPRSQALTDALRCHAILRFRHGLSPSRNEARRRNPPTASSPPEQTETTYDRNGKTHCRRWILPDLLFRAGFQIDDFT